MAGQHAGVSGWRQAITSWTPSVLNVTAIKDALLQFRCFDNGGNLVKTEEKNILLTPSALVLPSIQINMLNSDFWQTGNVNVQYLVDRSGSVFTSDNNLNTIFYPHIGFDYGQNL
ncbi:MAG: hypothetical protein IPL65_13695 [Lewinellaceae bacterium]|nr:hypothetical protein [Lewinellaceae bacterium]